MKKLVYLFLVLILASLALPNCTGIDLPPETETDCVNGIDDDGDGFIDCADFDCKNEDHCKTTEICDNGIDDDGDGFTDCEDSDCANFPGC